MSGAANLRSFLAADATLTNLVGTRIYPLILPQKPTLPAITYQWITAERIPVMDGPLEMTGPLVQIDAWASTYAQAEEVFEAIRQRLDGFKGTVGGKPFHGAFLTSERDLYESGADSGSGSGVAMYRKSSDYRLFYEETVVP